MKVKKIITMSDEFTRVLKDVSEKTGVNQSELLRMSFQKLVVELNGDFSSIKKL